MKITNLHNLPAPLVRAIELDPYSRGDADISVTQLIQPPRKIELERQHASELTEDASDRIWALIGQIGHLILERAGSGEMTEHRLSIMRHGWKISCAVDLWRNQWITDYKFVSGWAVKDGPKEEWIQQLNCQRLICIENGFDVQTLEIVCILRDWSTLEAKRNRDYPQAQVQVFHLPVWSIEEVEEWLSFAVLAHQDARTLLPQCTDYDRWAKPPVWAVRKRTNKRATALFDTLEEAEQRKGDNINLVIDERPGEWTRCENYCAVGKAGFCNQFNQYKNQTTQNL